MISYIVLGILIIFLAFIFSRFRPATTRKITDNLYSVRCGIGNFYALETTAGVVLFDTGMSAALARRGLRKLGLSPEAVTHIFLTHTDYDHSGGAKAFPKAGLYISKAEERMIDGSTARRGFMRNTLPFPYKTLEDGQTIAVGGVTVQLRLTPGHTAGSAVYMIDDRILVSGDLLRLSRRGEILPFLRLMNMDHRRDVQSVEDARNLIDNAEYILTGHTGIRKQGDH